MMTLEQQIDHMVYHLKSQQLGEYTHKKVLGSHSQRYKAEVKKDALFYRIGEITEYIRLIALGKVYTKCPLCKCDFSLETEE